MGYYTRYNVRTTENALSAIDLRALIESDENSHSALEADGSSKRWEKWYEHEEALRAWSAKFPATVFCLSAEGEDLSGTWKKFFTGGYLIAIREPFMETTWVGEASNW